MKNKAFTLIELLVTVAIISLLASIIFASLSSAREKSQDAHRVAEAKEVEKAIELHRFDNNYAVPYASSTTKGVLHEEGTDGYKDAMDILVTNGYLAAIPESPSGTDYAYMVSEDEKSAMFYSKQSSSSSTGDVCVRIGDDTFNQIGDGYSCTGSIATAEECFAFNPTYGEIEGYTPSADCPLDVVIPSTIEGVDVTGIGFMAFYQSKITSVVIPYGVTSINDRAFHLAEITSVTIPNSVISIGEFAFYLTDLNSVTIPNSVISIGMGGFQMTNLTSVTIPNSVTTLGGWAFYDSPLTSVTIPNSVTDIGVYAFRDTSLVSVTIPNSVTSIEFGTFYSVDSLTSVTIPNSVTNIAGNAFRLTDLTSVTIPDSVTNIADGAFWDTNLTSANSVSLNPATTTYNLSNSFPTGCTVDSGCIEERI